jgi:pimeloyl-ACP methyl ester carboxylesterase
VVDGWVDDDLALVRPWGFDLGSITAPVLIRHGDDDRFVPAAHARWLAEHIAGAEAEITAADGHLTLFETGISGVHDWLLRHVH